jgi:hypothetical protein
MVIRAPAGIAAEEQLGVAQAGPASILEVHLAQPVGRRTRTVRASDLGGRREPYEGLLRAPSAARGVSSACPGPSRQRANLHGATGPCGPARPGRTPRTPPPPAERLGPGSRAAGAGSRTSRTPAARAGDGAGSGWDERRRSGESDQATSHAALRRAGTRYPPGYSCGDRRRRRCRWTRRRSGRS